IPFKIAPVTLLRRPPAGKCVNQVPAGARQLRCSITEACSWRSGCARRRGGGIISTPSRSGNTKRESGAGNGRRGDAFDFALEAVTTSAPVIQPGKPFAEAPVRRAPGFRLCNGIILDSGLRRNGLE